MTLDQRLGSIANNIKLLREPISENARQIAQRRNATAAPNQRFKHLENKTEKLLRLARPRE